MSKFNVLVGVCAVVEADTEEDAVVKVEAQLRTKGFDTYDGPSQSLPDVFDSEDDTEVSF